MTPPPVRIGLLGLFGLGNFGNEGSLEAMLSFLRRVYPGAQFTCICGFPRKVERDYQISALPIRPPGPSSIWFRVIDRLLLRAPRMLDLWVRTVRQVRNFDFILVPGTGILQDFGGRPWLTPGSLPLSLFLWFAAARVCGIKTALVSVGAGPIRNPLNKWLLKSSARLAQYRSYRDTISRDFMIGLGVKANDGVYPDLAFGLPISEHDAGRKPTHGVVGIGIMDYHGWNGDDEDIYEAYIEKNANFIAYLLDRNYRIRILTGQASDHWAVGDLLRRLNTLRPAWPDGAIIAEHVCSLQDVMRQIQKTDVVVATRFHNVVCALKLGKPTISLGYSRKNDALMAEAGLGDFCQHVERFDLDWLIRQFTTLMDASDHYAELIKQRTAVLVQRLQEQEARLAENFLGRSAYPVERQPLFTP
jgi:polysaccharide pyruvyl transferase WcaK-like protein